MGEPGTKATLTLLSLMAMAPTMRSIDATYNLVFNRSAGDDFINYGSARHLVRQLESSVLLTAAIQVEKTSLYKWGCLYCEEAIIPPDEPMNTVVNGRG